MKKIILATLTVFVLSMFSNNANAQRSQGEVDITVGAGYAIGLGALKKVVDFALKESDLDKSTATPIINGMVDYGITENFSLGGAYSYYTWRWNDRWTDSLGVSTNGAVKLQRHNIAGRALFHFGNSEKTDLYAGTRLGVSVWTMDAEGDNSNGESASEFEISPSNFTFQALFGVRTYFNDFIGANFEVGIGNAPYFIAGGLTFRLGGN